MAVVPAPQARIAPEKAALRAVSFSPSLVRNGTGNGGAGDGVWAVLRCGNPRTVASVKTPANQQRHGRAIGGRIPEVLDLGQLRGARFLLSLTVGVPAGRSAFPLATRTSRTP